MSFLFPSFSLRVLLLLIPRWRWSWRQTCLTGRRPSSAMTCASSSASPARPPTRCRCALNPKPCRSSGFSQQTTFSARPCLQEVCDGTAPSASRFPHVTSSRALTATFTNISAKTSARASTVAGQRVGLSTPSRRCATPSDSARCASAPPEFRV